MYKDECAFLVLPFVNPAEARMSQARAGRSSEQHAEFVTAFCALAVTVHTSRELSFMEAVHADDL